MLTCATAVPAAVTCVALRVWTPEPVAKALVCVTAVKPVLSPLLPAMTRTSSSAPVPRTVESLKTSGARAMLPALLLQEPSRTSTW